MPILLDDIQASVSNTKIYSPKFFDSELTGNGKKMGLLKQDVNPIHIDPQQTTTNENLVLVKRKYHNGQTETLLIPFNPLSRDAWSFMDNVTRPDITDMAEIAQNNNIKVYFTMTAHSVVFEKTTTAASQNSGTSITKKLTPCYQLFLYFVQDATDTNHKQINTVQLLNRTSTNCFYTDFSCNPQMLLNNICQQLQQQNYNINNVAILDYINDYSLYTAIVKRSEEWQSTIDKTLETFLQNVQMHHYNSAGLNEVSRVLRYIENYAIPLDLYKNIYNIIKNLFHHDDAVKLCKQNLNLLLSDTLNDLNQSKNILTRIAPPNPPSTIPATVAKLSYEQQNAITSPEPLIMVQAGAGTGKSTVILGRIDYMIAAGVNPSDITVLSFTNAAADNISAKNPNIHSMTIARMIHTIYSANFPQHELSSIDTIINSLDIYYHDDDIANAFKNRLKAIAKTENNGFTSMNNFIEYHYDEVIAILNTIKQTSLELEIIICYQQIDNLIEPADLTSKYLIVDEVQDNSIFDFIYTLKYVNKHKESLFIVGDCSQTLYEFRAANPKALNVLESSGVFATYQLQINYRSNQEILDFANVALQNIEANQYAKIQLQANSLSKVTEQSFTDKVHFNYHRLLKITDFNDSLGSIFAVDIKPYIDAKLAAGEQVAFLAFTRNHIYKMQNILQGLYPDKKIINLVPDKMYNTVIFSEFIKKYWNEVQFIPTKSITVIVGQAIINKLQFLTYNYDKVLPIVQKMLAQWRADQQAIIDSWQNQYMSGQMSQNDFLNNVKESMLQFEIRNNAIKQALLSARNEENKKSQNANDADLILSTIHSAKGLEFDNVVVLYRNESTLAEDKKRMYYVAFTRAMKSEYILAYDTVVSPQIEADYNAIVKSLHDKQTNAPTIVATPTDTDDDSNLDTPTTAVGN